MNHKKLQKQQLKKKVNKQRLKYEQELFYHKIYGMIEIKYDKAIKSPEKMDFKVLTIDGTEERVYQKSGKLINRAEKDFLIIIKANKNGLFQSVFDNDFDNSHFIKRGSFSKKLINKSYAKCVFIKNKNVFIKNKGQKWKHKDRNQYYHDQIKRLKFLDESNKITLTQFRKMEYEILEDIDCIDMIIEKKKEKGIFNGRYEIIHFQTNSLLVKLNYIKLEANYLLEQARRNWNETSQYHQKQANYLMRALMGHSKFINLGLCFKCGNYGFLKKCKKCKSGVRVCSKDCFHIVWHTLHKYHCAVNIV